MKWELYDKNPIGDGRDETPVKYPRSEADRAQSNNNKGGASVSAGPGEVDYTEGPYPVVEEGGGGVDEGDGASR